ncbi:MAG: TolB family protein [Bdellovibrionota bacterium]
MPTIMGLPAFRCPPRIGVPCVLSEAGSHELVLYSFAPTSGAAKSEIFRIQVDDPNSLAWDLSPDGTRVVYAQHEFGSASIHVRELDTKTVRDILLKGVTDLSTLSWAADGKSLFATTFAVTGSSLLHITLDGKYRVLYKGAKEVEGARPSPDDRYLAFGDVVSASNVWLVEGLPK